MDDRISFVTLIPEVYAKLNNTFKFYGHPTSCKRCKLYTFCGRLRKGLKYRVVWVGKIKHSCPIYGLIVPVKVVLEDFEALVPSKAAVEGVVLRYPFNSCGLRRCSFHNLCYPPFLRKGDKVRIVKVEERSIYCRGKCLKLVWLRLLP